MPNPQTIPPTHIWCQDCGKIMKISDPVTLMKGNDGRFVGRDLVCEQRHVVATVFVEAS